VFPLVPQTGSGPTVPPKIAAPPTVATKLVAPVVACVGKVKFAPPKLAPQVRQSGLCPRTQFAFQSCWFVARRKFQRWLTWTVAYPFATIFPWQLRVFNGHPFDSRLETERENFSTITETPLHDSCRKLHYQRNVCRIRAKSA
jgi:hypothetical protein